MYKLRGLCAVAILISSSCFTKDHLPLQDKPLQALTSTHKQRLTTEVRKPLITDTPLYSKLSLEYTNKTWNFFSRNLDMSRVKTKQTKWVCDLYGS
jgi:hypothetical protein